MHVAICTGGCGVNKECTAPNTCTCVQGWTGQDCLTGMKCLILVQNNFVVPLKNHNYANTKINCLQPS